MGPCFWRAICQCWCFVWLSIEPNFSNKFGAASELFQVDQFPKPHDFSPQKLAWLSCSQHCVENFTVLSFRPMGALHFREQSSQSPLVEETSLDSTAWRTFKGPATNEAPHSFMWDRVKSCGVQGVVGHQATTPPEAHIEEVWVERLWRLLLFVEMLQDPSSKWRYLLIS